MLTKRLLPFLVGAFVCCLSEPTWAGVARVGAIPPGTSGFQQDEVIMLAPASFQVRNCMWAQAYLDYDQGDKGLYASFRVTEGFPSVSMAAPVHLPAGAVITSVRVSYYDTDPLTEPQMGIYGVSAEGETTLLVDTPGEKGVDQGDHSVTYRVASPGTPNAKVMAHEFLVTLNRSVLDPTIEHALYRVEIRYRNTPQGTRR